MDQIRQTAASLAARVRSSPAGERAILEIAAGLAIFRARVFRGRLWDCEVEELEPNFVGHFELSQHWRGCTERGAISHRCDRSDSRPAFLFGSAVAVRTDNQAAVS
jgi:hypothetical protein